MSAASQACQQLVKHVSSCITRNAEVALYIALKRMCFTYRKLGVARNAAADMLYLLLTCCVSP
jgi:hypothetical protein